MNDQSMAVDKAMNGDGSKSVTVKLQVDDVSLFMTVAWHEKRPVVVDVKMSMSIKTQRNNSEVKHARAAMEVISRHATAMLKSGNWTLDEIIDEWAGTQIYYGGICRQLPMIDGEYQKVSGLLDAASRYIRHKKQDWMKQYGK